MLHLLNGDATAVVFPASLPGERDVWRDIMVEGPAVADGAVRAAWLAPRLGVTPATYEARWREGEATLARASVHDEVILWFEQDLFCAVNLWFVLERLPAATAISLVFPALGPDFAGLGTLAPDAFGPLFEQRTRLEARARAEARALWQAYAASEPTGFPRATGQLPFTRTAVRLHLGRFPSTTHGLDDTELSTLHALGIGPRTFGELFATVVRRDLAQYGMGDVQYAAALRDLEPLVAIDDASRPFADWRLSLTATGDDVLGERLDGLAPRAIDRWLGGVHLRPGGRMWRWDGSRVLRE
ncbi:MAG TPA: hypothetical protein VHZ49_16560 [Methylomirabilota bacterium]|nr:hypothetical protein [Methylomirabilota bacterium]